MANFGQCARATAGCGIMGAAADAAMNEMLMIKTVNIFVCLVHKQSLVCVTLGQHSTNTVCVGTKDRTSKSLKPIELWLTAPN